MNLVMILTALTLLLLPALADAQFQQVGGQTKLPERFTRTKVCDTSAFPPFNRYGPRRFDLCDGATGVVGSCHITASTRARKALPSPMLRRALLRLIEEFEAGTGVQEAVHSALAVKCARTAAAPAG